MSTRLVADQMMCRVHGASSYVGKGTRPSCTCIFRLIAVGETFDREKLEVVAQWEGKPDEQTLLESKLRYQHTVFDWSPREALVQKLEEIRHQDMLFRWDFATEEEKDRVLNRLQNPYMEPWFPFMTREEDGLVVRVLFNDDEWLSLCDNHNLYGVVRSPGSREDLCVGDKVSITIYHRDWPETRWEKHDWQKPS